MADIKKRFLGLNEPLLGNEEVKIVTKCIKSNWISSAGSLIDNFEKKISNYTGAKYAVACSNATSALQISLKILGVKKNDEVIVPTLTFISSVNAIVLNGASPIFMDVDDFHNIDADKTVNFLKENTFFKNGYTFNKHSKKRIKALIIVHVWGNAANLYKLLKFCKKKNIDIVEDAAESLGTKYSVSSLKNKHTGTLGRVGCISFNGNKIITTGGGGVLLTNEKKLNRLARYYFNQAKDDTIKSIHNDIGFNYRISNMQAALGIAQLKKINFFIQKKKVIRKTYQKLIKKLNNFTLEKSPDYSSNNNWMNVVRFKKSNKLNTENLVKYFYKHKIQVRPIWFLNHMQKPYKAYEKYKITNAKKIIDSCLCLPSSSNLKILEIKKICKLLENF